jgi:hypothetical protein
LWLLARLYHSSYFKLQNFMRFKAQYEGILTVPPLYSTMDDGMRQRL